tara:strand:- start:3258 stop:4532 length:1275 start_codon:yes stop_codon:yes gene_type:complete
MSASIESNPNNFQVANQPLIYAVKHVTTVPDRFIIEVFEDGVAAAISTLYLTPNDSNKVFFDLSEIVRNRVAVDYKNSSGSAILLKTTNPYSTAVTGCRKFTVKVGTYTGGVVTLNDDSDFTIIIGGAGQASEPNPRNIAAYYPISSNSKLWLTDRVPDSDNVIHYNFSDYSYASVAFINDSVILPTLQTKVIYKLYNKTTQLGPDDIWTLDAAQGAQLPSDTDVTQKLTYMGIGTRNVGHVPWASRPAAYSGWTHYEMYAADAGGNRLGSTIRVHRICPLQNKHKNYMLYWDNSLGGWDSLIFTGRAEQTDMTSYKTYQKQLGNFNGATLSFDTLGRQTAAYQVTGKTSYKLMSLDFSFSDIELLKYAIRGKQLFLKDDGIIFPTTADLMPVNMDTTSYNVKEAFSGTFTVSLTVTLAQTIRC